jgi:1-acyl-sn-glycerol-3-phosphate acyltransferase
MTILRSATFNLMFFIATFVATVAATLMRPVGPDRVFRTARLWARTVVVLLRAICGVRLSVVGLELLPPGPALIASRHQSAFDTLVWLTLLPRCCYVLKSELLRIPLWGGLTRATGMIAIDRAAGAGAIRSLVRAGEDAIRQDRQIVIFPEGTRGEPGQLLPLQPGIAALALHSGLPVFPVVTDSGSHWGRRAFRKQPGTIHIVVHPPIPGGVPRRELMQRLESVLQRPVSGPPA